MTYLAIDVSLDKIPGSGSAGHLKPRKSEGLSATEA